MFVHYLGLSDTTISHSQRWPDMQPLESGWLFCLRLCHFSFFCYHNAGIMMLNSILGEYCENRLFKFMKKAFYPTSSNQWPLLLKVFYDGALFQFAQNSMLADRVKSSNKEKIKCQVYFQDATSVGNFFNQRKS